MVKKFHLGLFSSPPVMHHTVGGWKHPRNIKRGYRWDRPEVWQHCARLAEGAKFDFVFSAGRRHGGADCRLDGRNKGNSGR